MTERQQTPELKVIPAEELLDTACLKDIHEDCVANVGNVGNDGILNAGDGHKNIYNTCTTYTDVPDGQEGV